MVHEVMVTRKDIDRGVPCDRLNCPVVIALERTFPDAHNITVTDQCIRVDDTEYDAPSEVTDFVWALDNKHGMTPFSFTLQAHDIEPFDL